MVVAAAEDEDDGMAGAPRTAALFFFVAITFLDHEVEGGCLLIDDFPGELVFVPCVRGE